MVVLWTVGFRVYIALFALSPTNIYHIVELGRGYGELAYYMSVLEKRTLIVFEPRDCGVREFFVTAKLLTPRGHVGAFLRCHSSTCAVGTVQTPCCEALIDVLFVEARTTEYIPTATGVKLIPRATPNCCICRVRKGFSTCTLPSPGVAAHTSK